MLIQYCTVVVEYLFSLTRYYSISSDNIEASWIRVSQQCGFCKMFMYLVLTR